MRFRRLWVWTGEEYMFYQSKCVGSVLHVCSGRSEFGDVKVDRYQKADVKADYRFLPFKDKTFDTVICDPYWGKTEKSESWHNKLAIRVKEGSKEAHRSNPHYSVFPPWMESY